MDLLDWLYAVLFALFVGGGIWLARIVIKDVIRWWKEGRR